VLSKTIMLCIVDLYGDEETIFVTDEKTDVVPVLPPFVPMPMLQIVPVENDES